MVYFLVKVLFMLQLFIMMHNSHGCKPSFDIHNDLPKNTPRLKFHCASGDDDLGYHYPAIGSDFHWSFCATPSTLFFCHFWWNGKDLSFDVFNTLFGCVTDGHVPDYVVNCHWQVKADGINLGYFDNDVQQIIYTKYRDW
uniref:S-protein homolog n=1 Tax=Solanum lycopersicum TaxID=4081 RepID=A0A3Q7I863_SOLLC